MAVIVIGGQSRHIGKTSIACALISATPEVRWTAIKITSHQHHNVPDPTQAAPNDATPPAFTITEEHDSTIRTDTSRYLASGAARALLIEAAPGQLSQTMTHIQNEIDVNDHALIESNNILDHLQPDFYAVVLNPKIGDFKASALRQMERADAILEVAAVAESVSTFKISSLREIPVFRIAPPAWSSTPFFSFVTEKLHKSRK